MSSKLTAEIQKKIIENLATNPTVPSAAVRAGVSPGTLRDWLAKGEAGHPDFAAFAQEAAQSRAAIKDSVIQALIETATDCHHPQQVRAAAKLLESLYPREFAAVRHEVRHEAKAPDLDLSRLPSGELRDLQRIVKRLKSDALDADGVKP